MKNIKAIGLSAALLVASGSALATPKNTNKINYDYSTNQPISNQGYVESNFAYVEHSSAGTAQYSAPANNHSSGVYAGADFGSAEMSLTDTSEKYDSDNFRAFLGYQLNQYFAVEGGVSSMEFENDLGAVADLTGIDVSLLAMLPITSKFSAYAKLGYWDWEIENSTIEGNTKYINRITNSDILYGIGLEYKVSPRFKVRVDATRYQDGGDDHIDIISGGLAFTY